LAGWRESAKKAVFTITGTVVHPHLLLATLLRQLARSSAARPASSHFRTA
jgi:hypothetical protein